MYATTPAKAATDPTNPALLDTAPEDGVAVEELEDFEAEEPEDVVGFSLEGVVEVEVALATIAGRPPVGATPALVTPEIWAATAGEKVPVIPVRMNLLVKASRGAPVVSTAASEVNRMK